MPSHPFAEILVPLDVEGPFTYRLPDALAGRARVGCRVRVPLGRKTTEGVLTGFCDHAPSKTMKDVLEILDDEPMFSSGHLRWLDWIADYYLCSRGSVLRAAYPFWNKPVGPGAASRRYHLADPLAEIPASAPAQRRAIEALRTASDGLDTAVLKNAGITAGVLKALEKKGIVAVESRRAPRDPMKEIDLPDHPVHPLTPSQKEALDAVTRDLPSRSFRCCLLHGVTASGKTEIYLHAAAAALALGRQVLVLVPEIGLTPQLIGRFRSRYGGRVALLHSNLSDGERFDAWEGIRSSVHDIVVGTRSAVFASFRDLGLVIVDEEHDPSYKQEEGVRYHARDAAVVRARECGATVILGSATPALESFANAASGKYALVTLPGRLDDRTLPAVRVADLKQRERLTVSAILSDDLIEAIRDRLNRKEQTLLFLNRRGFSPLLLCEDCGDTATCAHCSIALTYHKRDHHLLCHYCGYQKDIPVTCSACQGSRLSLVGMGTEKVEEEVARLFPAARVARMDRDTTGPKWAHHRILQRMSAGEADILIGTQMIAKGHDLPNITLVGVLCADLAYYLPDFRAGERTFQLLTQVAGRAGRRDVAGEVVIQTYNPTHDVLRHAMTHDYAGFYASEIASRGETRFPPFVRLVSFLVRGKDEARTRRAAETLFETARAAAGRHKAVDCMGPVPAPIARLKGWWRWQVLLKSSQTRLLNRVAREILDHAGNGKRSSTIRIDVDVDPQSLL